MARRRSNGEGTIYRRKDGRYEGAAYVLTTSGTTKRVRVYGATRAEVDRKLTESKAKSDRGIAVDERNWKVGDYLDYWLEEVVKPGRRPATYAQCETVVRLYLKPELGATPLSQLSIPAVQRYVNQLIADGHSVSKVHVVRKVLSAALTRAQRDELVSRNVARLVELPPLNQREASPWSFDEVSWFLAVVHLHYLNAALLLLAIYGLRRGETLGLRWQDVDYDLAVIHIRQQLIRVGQNVLIGPLKTRASIRDLPLLDPVANALRAHHEEQQARGIKSELVFTTLSGTPIEPRNFTRSFERFCRRQDLRAITVHDLRHTAATTLKTLKVTPVDAKRILGHSRITTTLGIYEHSNLDDSRSVMSQVERALLVASHRDDRPGIAAGAADGYRCRQLSRQTRKNPALWLGSFSGAGTGTLTLDLFHGKNKQCTAIGRASEVRHVAEDRKRAWTLGAVAVNLAVKPHEQTSL